MTLPRFTIRRLTILVALIALGCFVTSELWDGLPPRFVVRGLKGRIERLKPGMSHEEVVEILGLNKSWLRGGTGATAGIFDGDGHFQNEEYYVRPPRIVTRTATVGSANGPVGVYESRTTIQLIFETPGGIEDPLAGRPEMKLRSAWASDDGRIIAEVPGGR